MDSTAAIGNIQDIEINEDFKRAIDAINSGKSNIYITGPAGTDKSTFLNFFRKTIKKKSCACADWRCRG